MLNRLYDNWVYGGFLFAFILLGLTPFLSGSWPPGLLLIWLHLPVYMLHQYEEHDADRFREFVNATIGGGKNVLSHSDVFVINIGGVWVVDALAFLLAAQLHLGLGLIAVYLSLVNTVGHCAQAIALRRYNPGLVTSILMFLPLSTLTLWVLAGTGDVSIMDHLIGLGAAMLIHAGIIVRVVTNKRKLELANA